MTETTTTSTRNSKATKQFLAADGSVSAHANVAAVACVFKFANGQDLTIDPTSFNETISRCLMLHGIMQKFGDSYAGSADAAEAYESAANLYEAMSGEDGTWLQKGESAGPRVSMLAEAVARAKPEKYDIVSATEMLKAKDKDGRKVIAKIPAVEAAFAAIRAERAIAAADKAAQAAGAVADDSDF